MQVDRIDGETDGEVEIVPDIVYSSDYEEYISRKRYEPYISRSERIVYSHVVKVGGKINSPRWLTNEVFNILVKIRRGVSTATLPLKEKAILALFYAVAYNNNVFSVVKRIEHYPCGPGGEPCFINKRRADPEFKRYLSKVSSLLPVLVGTRRRRSPEKFLESMVEAGYLSVPQNVYRTAVRIIELTRPVQGGKKVATIVAGALILAHRLHGLDVNPKVLVARLGTSEPSAVGYAEKLYKYLMSRGLLGKLFGYAETLS